LIGGKAIEELQYSLRPPNRLRVAVTSSCLKRRTQFAFSSGPRPAEITCSFAIQNSLTLQTLQLNEERSITFSSKPLSQGPDALRLPRELKHLPDGERHRDLPRATEQPPAAEQRRLCQRALAKPVLNCHHQTNAGINLPVPCWTLLNHPCWK